MITAALALALVAAVVLLISGGGGSSGGYVVRAAFDSGGFMVPGEQVRVAGANVGEIKSVSVSMPGEVDSYKDGRPQAVPGKAILAMEITDPGFQDFRSDASCLIRPQSLIGEKFVDCRPTLPRAPGSPPPPPLKQVPSGQPGAGEYLLPLENNSTSVDPDLINNIQTLPYAQRFRLILNELGAGLAGRGSDIEEVVKRANPVLRDADRLLGILAAQRKQLAQLAANSEEVLRPLARERAHVAGFLANAGAAAQASSERGPALEASLRKFPRFLREFRLTMRSLQGFSDAGAPVFTDLGRAAPSLTDATRTLAPFFEASTVALKSLGAAGEVAGPLFREADPIVRKTTELARAGAQPNTNLAKLFVSLKKTRGWDGLLKLIYDTTATVNGFDQYGHFLRSLVTLTNCTDYEANKSGESACTARFSGPNARAATAASVSSLYRHVEEALQRLGGGTGAAASSSSAPTTGVGRAGPAPERGKSGGTAPLLNHLPGR